MKNDDSIPDFPTFEMCQVSSIDMPESSPIDSSQSDSDSSSMEFDGKIPTTL